MPAIAPTPRPKSVLSPKTDRILIVAAIVIVGLMLFGGSRLGSAYAKLTGSSTRGGVDKAYSSNVHLSGAFTLKSHYQAGDNLDSVGSAGWVYSYTFASTLSRNDAIQSIENGLKNSGFVLTAIDQHGSEISGQDLLTTPYDQVFQNGFDASKYGANLSLQVSFQAGAVTIEVHQLYNPVN